MTDPLKSPAALYIHIPFCKVRCSYCDFNTYAGVEHLKEAFTDALIAELNFVGLRDAKHEIKTIFFGGGTPSLLTIGQFEKIIRAINNNFSLSPNAEISLEANPGTTEQPVFNGLIDLGFNRISFGVQSSDLNILKFLDRIHDFDQVVNSYDHARAAGFQNINLDLIFGIPGQSMGTWQKTIADCMALQPEHLSAYALGIEVGTPLGKWYSKGLIPAIDQDLAADQYLYVMEELEKHGYQQYEISNWSKPGRKCNHNLSYWRNENYFAFGPGAHGHFDRVRYSNVRWISEYIKLLSESKDRKLTYPCAPSVSECKPNSMEDELEDDIMCRLRLVDEGVNIADINHRFNIDFELKYNQQIKKLVNYGLVECVDGVFKLSKKGILLGNQVFLEFINET